jgi:hypothetical protein
MRISVSIALATIVFCASRCPAKGPPQTQPAPVYSIPSAISPGTTDIVFHDDALGDPIGLWAPFPAQIKPLPSESHSGEAKYRITVAPDVTVGIYATRLMTSTGVSHLRLLMVDDLPGVANAGKNTTLKHAQEISLPVAIDGACEPAAADYYRIAAKKGQSITVEVVAQRMGSLMDPMVRLLDSGGREMAYCDDSPGAGVDCRFRHTFVADGDYFIEVRDVNYEGGPGFRYHLRLGDFPLVACVSPLGGTRGASTIFHFSGDGCAQLPDFPVTLPTDVDRTWLRVKYPGGQGSALVPVLCTDLPESLESKFNNTPQTANHINLPVAITGQFTRPGDQAYFEFNAAEGERISVRGQTRALGSLATLSLQLLDSAGKKVADPRAVVTKPPKSTDVVLSNGPDDGALAATIPATGVYRVLARELSGSGGPGMFYRLEFRQVQPGFTLSVDTDIANAAAGASFTLKVSATRRNYDGPIKLSLSGAATGFEVSSAVIPAGKNDIELLVAVPKDVPTIQPLSFGITGQATVNGALVTARASTRAELSKLFYRMPTPPPELDGLIGLGVR